MYFCITHKPRKAYWKMLHESVFNKLLDKSQSWLYWHGLLEEFRGDSEEIFNISNMCLCWLCAIFASIKLVCIFGVSGGSAHLFTHEGAGLCVLALVWGSCVCAACWKLYERLQPKEFVMDLWVCEPAAVCFSGAGLGLLPFSISPVTPTASTNCDTGTHSSTELSLSVSHNIVCVLMKIFYTYHFQSCHYFLLVWVNWLIKCVRHLACNRNGI